MNTRYGHVTYTKLGIRHVLLRYFCRDFKINLAKHTHNGKINKDVQLEENFVYFLLENKTFIQIYDLDYYSDKSVEIIANKIGRPESEVSNYLKSKNYKVDSKYPYRYLSSYKIDFELGAKYPFLFFLNDHIYEGNYEFRRKQE